jgi:hypothetical protein
MRVLPVNSKSKIADLIKMLPEPAVRVNNDILLWYDLLE